MSERISRIQALNDVCRSFKVHPAVAIAGPRQCGKTTLALEFAKSETTVTHFDLEKAVDHRRLESAEQALSPLLGLVIIDEVQRKPELFETLRVLLDRPDSETRFLLLGSASPDLVSGVSESLAGRVGVIDLGGFDLREIGPGQWKNLWVRGGFPRSFLTDDESSFDWRRSFIRTFLERDIPQFGINVPAETLRRFWTMIAHYHGQVWKGSDFARSLGTSEPTARRYLDILAGCYMIRILPPWFENLKKRQLKAPKIYIRDSGLLHGLLDLENHGDLLGHPKLGSSWEGYAIEQILGLLGRHARNVYYWATHGGAELDLFVMIKGKRYGFEFKHSDAPGTTKSMRIAQSDLNLDHLWVIYPGTETYPLDDTITATSIQDLPKLIEKLKTS